MNVDPQLRDKEMRRVTGSPDPHKGFRNVMLAKRLELVFNALVVVAFVLGLFCFSMPGLHIILERNLINLVAAPLYFLVFIHLTSLLGVLIAFNPRGNSLISQISVIFLPCMVLWIAITWSWVIHTILARKFSTRHWQRFSRWFAPVMLWVLSLLWVAQIPLSVNFAFHKAGFEKLADHVMVEPSGIKDFTPNQQMGIFSISGLFRRSQTIASIETTSEHSLWAHEGFVRDLSRKPRGLKAYTYSLAPGSNNGDQDIFYLGDGWYVFQNLFD